VKLTFHVVKGSLLPAELSLYGKLADECPAGFVPNFDECVRVITVNARQEVAQRHCEGYRWVGQKGTLYMPKNPMKMNFITPK
jgi:hypothetical protein